MSLSAAALQMLMDKGLTIADVVEFARVIEADTAPAAMSPGAIRTRRYRANKAQNVTGDVTVTRDGDDKSVSPTPPSEKPPIPPLKGGTFPQTDAITAKPIAEWVEKIWEITPPPAKARSSKADVERALKAALRRDHTADAVVDGVEAYYASADAAKDGAKFAKGAHRIIENDRWQSFEALPTPIQPDADPWPRRMREFRANGYWNTTDWGPKPGKPGCRAPENLLMERAA